MNYLNQSRSELQKEVNVGHLYRADKPVNAAVIVVPKAEPIHIDGPKEIDNILVGLAEQRCSFELFEKEYPQVTNKRRDWIIEFNKDRFSVSRVAELKCNA